MHVISLVARLQLHGSTAANAVWILPGSHRWGHLDIPQMVATHGERLPTAVPMISEPGDVVSHGLQLHSLLIIPTAAVSYYSRGTS